MHFKQIETFYWAAKLGSFTAAAQRVHATQSTVSMRIQELENSLGVALFDRQMRTARLTAKGRELIGYAEQLIRLREEISRKVAAPESLTGVVRLGVAEVVSLTWLPAFVKTLHRQYPGITLELDEALTEDLVEHLREGKLDVILAPSDLSGLHVIAHPLGSMDFQWMASPDLPIPRGRLTPTKLAAFPIISLSQKSYHYATTEHWFKSEGTFCRRIDTCMSLGVVASLVAAGLGVGLLPPQCFRRQIRDRRLRVLSVQPPMKPVQFAASILPDTFGPVTRAIVDLAVELSTFERIQPGSPAASARRTKAH